MIEDEIKEIVRQEVAKQLKAYTVALVPHEIIKKPEPKQMPRMQPKQVMDNDEKPVEQMVDEELGGEEEEELDWDKEQDGNLEKGETQIWRYGNHVLTVWTEGKKYFAQTNDEKPETLWKQSDLEKIQKRIEKMEQ